MHEIDDLLHLKIFLYILVFGTDKKFQKINQNVNRHLFRAYVTHSFTLFQ
jgi:hypothetical protein